MNKKKKSFSNIYLPVSTDSDSKRCRFESFKNHRTREKIIQYQESTQADFELPTKTLTVIYVLDRFMKRLFLGLLVCGNVKAKQLDPAGSIRKIEFQALSLKLGCQASLSKANSDELLCFKNAIIDQGLQTETQGCSLRIYNLNDKKFESFPYYLSTCEILLTPKLCQAGGLRSTTTTKTKTQ